MGNRVHLAVDLSAKRVGDRESPASIVNFTQSRFTNAIAIRLDNLGNGHAIYGNNRSLHLEIVHLGESRSEAVKTAVPAVIVHYRGVAKRLSDWCYPRFIHSAVVRSVVERAEFNGDSAAAPSIWESRMNGSGGYQPSRNGQHPELYSIGAEQSLPAWVSHLEVVIPIGKSSRRWRSARPRPAVEIHAGGTALRAVLVLVDDSASNISGENRTRKRWGCSIHRKLRDRNQQRSKY